MFAVPSTPLLVGHWPVRLVQQYLHRDLRPVDATAGAVTATSGRDPPAAHLQRYGSERCARSRCSGGAHRASLDMCAW